MSLLYIRKTYGVPAWRGARIIWANMGREYAGTITGSRGAYLRVQFDNWAFKCLLHPTWGVRYLTGDEERVSREG